MFSVAPLRLSICEMSEFCRELTREMSDSALCASLRKDGSVTPFPTMIMESDGTAVSATHTSL